MHHEKREQNTIDGMRAGISAAATVSQHVETGDEAGYCEYRGIPVIDDAQKYKGVIWRRA